MRNLFRIIFLVLLFCMESRAQKDSIFVRQQKTINENGLQENTDTSPAASLQIKPAIHCLGTLLFRRTYADAQFMKNDKQIEAYYDRQKKSYPILLLTTNNEEIKLLDLLQKNGLVRNKSLLIDKFKSGSKKDFVYADSLGRKMKISLSCNTSTASEKIDVFNHADSCQYKFADGANYFGPQYYKLIHEKKYENKKILVLANYWYIMNGDNYDVSVFEITFDPIKVMKDE